MSRAPRTAATPATELPNDIVALQHAIDDLPSECRSRVLTAVDRVIESTQRRRRILALVQDALGQLRLDMKYLMFDLEATRRERDGLRRQIDEGTGQID
jgi:hypothetical protein